MTTNAGSVGVSAMAGFSKTEEQTSEDKTQKALAAFLRPEFINRIDEIITFNHLSKEDFVSIAKIMIKELADALAEKDIVLTCDEAVYTLLTEKAYSVKYGARNLRRLIQTEIEDKAAELVIASFDSKVTGIAVFAEGEEIRVAVKK